MIVCGCLLGQITDQGYILNLAEYHKKYSTGIEAKIERLISTWDRRGFIGRFSIHSRVDSDKSHSIEDADAPCWKHGQWISNHQEQATAFAAATMSEFTIEAGEALFLPAGWAHEVESLGTHLAITYWLRPDDGQLHNSATGKTTLNSRRETSADSASAPNTGKGSPPKKFKSRKEQIQHQRRQKMQRGR